MSGLDLLGRLRGVFPDVAHVTFCIAPKCRDNTSLDSILHFTSSFHISLLALGLNDELIEDFIVEAAYLLFESCYRILADGSLPGRLAHLGTNFGFTYELLHRSG